MTRSPDPVLTRCAIPDVHQREKRHNDVGTMAGRRTTSERTCLISATRMLCGRASSGTVAAGFDMMSPLIVAAPTEAAGARYNSAIKDTEA